jgi:imidazole glycerol phosphate synthase glutamine amidotransferase subunit
LIELIHYGGGNLGSVARCFTRLGIDFRWVRAAEQFSGDHPVVLPGVGAFGAVMQALHDRGLVEPLIQVIGNGLPYLGICVGLQILFAGSEEAPGERGLNLVSGEVVRFKNRKVPQIGWNKVIPASGRDFPSGYAYFVNSYYADCSVPQAILYRATYGVEFCAAVQIDNITAFQFHPEKSGTFGQEVLKRWIDAL